MKFKTTVSIIVGTILAAGAYICSVFAGGAWKEVKERRQKAKEKVKEDIKETTETKEEKEEE